MLSIAKYAEPITQSKLIETMDSLIYMDSNDTCYDIDLFKKNWVNYWYFNNKVIIMSTQIRKRDLYRKQSVIC